MSLIECVDLTRDFGNGRGIFHVSFAIKKGEVFGFLGPNGAGKTTTIRHLMGFLKPRQGCCTIDGKDCWRNAAEIQKKVGYIPGELVFFEEMSGLEYLNFLQAYRGGGDKRRMDDLMARFALDPKGKIKKMSKGMKQKIGIVAALMHDPEILILDEPTSGLDPLMQNSFIDLIREEKQRGKTILMSSHIFEEVEKTCDRIGIIRKGEMVALDTTKALRARHMKTYTVTLEDGKTAAAFAKDFNGIQDSQQPRKVTVTAQQNLEEIFMHYYGEEKTL